MLCNIDHGLIEYAQRVLTLLYFASTRSSKWPLLPFGGSFQIAMMRKLLQGRCSCFSLRAGKYIVWLALEILWLKPRLFLINLILATLPLVKPL